MGYIVIAPLVIAKGAGGDVYLYEGASVPTDLPDDEIERLADEDFIVEVPEAADPDPAEPVEPVFDVATAKLAELRDYAAANSIDLDEATKIDDVRAKITAATQV